MRTSFLGKVHFMPIEYDPETRAKAVRLVMEHREDYPSERAGGGSFHTVSPGGARGIS
jgi:hypothetical protein